MNSGELKYTGVSELDGIVLSSGSSLAPTRDISERQRANLRYLDYALHRHWGLGRNIVLGWCATGGGIEALMLPYYRIADVAVAASQGSKATKPLPGADTAPPARTVLDLVPTMRRLGSGTLHRLARRLGVAPVRIELPHPHEPVDPAMLNEVVRRYGICYAESRAVALFDIVRFSTYSPFAQMMMLNSLSYSVNAAQSKMRDKQIDINFARSTTGDGFYIWNRDLGVQADTNLYYFMHLILADNAIARSKDQQNLTPWLRTAFHLGGGYEFYQAEGLSPTVFSYIVGDVTIELARMIDKALPGQVMVGDFKTAAGRGAKRRTIDTVGFVDELQAGLSNLRGLELSGDAIESIKCYLTGTRLDGGRYSIRKYRVTDKHGFTRNVFNAKINIYRKDSQPIFLGIPENELSGFEVAEDAFPG